MIELSEQIANATRLLKSPSVENWKAIVLLGRRCAGKPEWPQFSDTVLDAVKSWPGEIKRICPPSWPSEFREQVEHRIKETDVYGLYSQKICGDPRLQLDGKQRVWLERRFTGGVVPASVAQQVIAALLEVCRLTSVGAIVKLVRESISILAGSIRNTGRVGTADLTGGVILVIGERRVDVRLEVEIKVGVGKQRPEQVARQRSVTDRGGCYLLSRSVEEAIQGILHFIVVEGASRS